MTRKYAKVTDEQRLSLIEMIRNNMTIKDAARQVEIKYENAKAIYRVYRKEQRTQKLRNRFRKKVSCERPKSKLKKETTRGKQGKNTVKDEDDFDDGMDSDEDSEDDKYDDEDFERQQPAIS